MEKVSIVIPVYNAQESLKRAVESALSQHVKPYEIILVNDGSTDDSGRICDELAAKHEEVSAYHMEDKGVSCARNEGLKHVTGDFVTFLDSDDMLAPEMLQELLKVQREHDSDVTGCDFRDGDGSTVIYRGDEIIRDAILKEHDTRVWSKLYRKSAIENVTFMEGLSIGEDMLFLLDVVKDSTVYALIKKDLYYYTVNPAGAMERPFVPSYMDQLRCWDEAGSLIAKEHSELLKDREVTERLDAIRIVSAVLVGSKIARLPDRERKQFREHWDTARFALKSYRKTKGAKKYLPEGYGLKSFLFALMPHVFSIIMRK